jgi:hypothetical protein
MFKSPLIQDLVRYPSLIGTIGVNVAPLLGIFIWGLGVGPLVLLYWLENVVVGGITLLRMITTGLASGIGALSLIIFIPFFTFHYGLFCFVHGIFMMTFFSGVEGTSMLVESPIALFGAALHAASGVPVILGLIAAWRLTLFGTQFVLRGDFTRSDPMVEMMRPYGRIITMHLAILAGAFALMALGQPTWGMFGLIGLKTGFDLFGARKDALGIQADPAIAKSSAAYQELQEKLKMRLTKKPPAA